MKLGRLYLPKLTQIQILILSINNAKSHPYLQINDTVQTTTWMC